MDSSIGETSCTTYQLELMELMRKGSFKGIQKGKGSCHAMHQRHACIVARLGIIRLEK